MIKSMLAVIATVPIMVLVGASPATAHVHVAENTPQQQPLANGQNHPGYQPVNADGLRLSCDGVLEPADAGPAGYGIEVAHHGPDAGTPGNADGCYAVVGNPTDGNPAIN